jgi:hypothetical protein
MLPRRVPHPLGMPRSALPSRRPRPPPRMPPPLRTLTPRFLPLPLREHRPRPPPGLSLSPRLSRVSSRPLAASPTARHRAQGIPGSRRSSLRRPSRPRRPLGLRRPLELRRLRRLRRPPRQPRARAGRRPGLPCHQHPPRQPLSAPVIMRIRAPPGPQMHAQVPQAGRPALLPVAPLPRRLRVIPARAGPGVRPGPRFWTNPAPRRGRRH